ncbi:hypothetical protein [Loktanella sp. Alg231-35]|uniref:hypothetical protein n=1 Tax=Loktanella sp. Alg231-35 TaxID=1922220 RepID=UPI00131EF7D4|nr:hypothetical protein [Loktanella sp. Alg231-35]
MSDLLRMLALSILGCLPSQATAQLVATPETQPEICPDRPSEPPFLENMDVRDSLKKILVQRMYRAASFQTIVETGDCSCDARFPAWDITVNYYLENYARLEDQWEIQETTKVYRDSINKNRPAARDICIAKNNWK